jgi:hypothetical protein
MSWASRRRTGYLLGVLLFFAVVIGIPAAIWLYEPPACFDGQQNQGETAIDKGGPCRILDERSLIPHSTLWARALAVRGGNYNAIAYIENPNKEAGVRTVGYHFGLYDQRNILVAEREGVTFIMPGGITPVFEGAINTGNREVVRTYFEFTDAPVWESMTNAAGVLVISNKQVSSTDSVPRLTATVTNTSVASVLNPTFAGVVFDPAGNAFAASATALSRLEPGEKREIVFTWPDPFLSAVGRIDVLPFIPPAQAPLSGA